MKTKTAKIILAVFVLVVLGLILIPTGVYDWIDGIKDEQHGYPLVIDRSTWGDSVDFQDYDSSGNWDFGGLDLIDDLVPGKIDTTKDVTWEDIHDSFDSLKTSVDILLAYIDTLESLIPDTTSRYIDTIEFGEGWDSIPWLVSEVDRATPLAEYKYEGSALLESPMKCELCAEIYINLQSIGLVLGDTITVIWKSDTLKVWKQ